MARLIRFHFNDNLSAFILISRMVGDANSAFLDVLIASVFVKTLLAKMSRILLYIQLRP